MPKGSRRDKDGLLKADEVSTGGAPVPISPGELPPPSAGRPAAAGEQARVEVVKDDDGAVRSIVVRCSCGREITLQCEYQDGGKP